MDFFKNIANRLEELDRLAQQANEQLAQDPKNLFRPKTTQDGMDHTREKFGSVKGKKKRSRQAVSGTSCPVDDKVAQQVPKPKPQGKEFSIFDNLAGHLDDALLLQEVLGAPRCMRGWDD